MVEYIDKLKLQEDMAALVPYSIDESNASYVDGLNAAYYLICNEPSADVQPVKYAQWIMHYYEPDQPFTCYCSDCGAYLPWVNGWQPNYCPMCGARMDNTDG